MKKNKSTVWIILAIFMFGIISFLFTILVSKGKDFDEEKQSLEKQLKEYINENDKLKEDIEIVNDKLKKIENGQCEYTQTFYYLGDYEYTAHVPTHKFIIVDRFQEFSPIILEIDTEQFDIEFKEKHNYEITFVEGISNSSFSRPIIKEIKETDKLGLNQIQESCKI